MSAAWCAARALGNRIGADLAIVDKRRERAGESEVMNIIGNVEERHCLLVVISLTVPEPCATQPPRSLSRALKVSAHVTHGVLSGEACDRVNASKLEKLLFTNTIAPTEAILTSDKFEIIKIAPLIKPCAHGR